MLEAEDVGTAMGRLRGERTQLEVARRAGINRSSWSSYESGRRMPKPETYGRIVHGLECTEDDLDRAVMRAWHERLEQQAEDATEAGTITAPPQPPEAPEPWSAGAGPGVVLSLQEVVDLASHSEHLQQLVRRMLHRRGVPPQR